MYIDTCFPRLVDDECGDDKRGDDRRGDDRRGDAWGTLGANTAWSTQTLGAYLLPLRALEASPLRATERPRPNR